jgi:dipeptidyl-peptidase-3
LWVTFHEAFGHGTGKFFEEDHLGNLNFNRKVPPLNPLTGTHIDSWYGPGQTWTGVFGAIATSVDECRAECVGAYLMSDMELLALFGYSDGSRITGQARKCPYLRISLF